MPSIPVSLKDVSLTMEQLDNLASEFHGKIMILSGIDDECEVIFEKELDFSKEFKQALKSFKNI